MSNFIDKELFLEPKVTQYGNHMVMTNVIKPTKRKYLNIDTRFRDDYDEYSKNPTFYNITLPERINDVKSIMTCNAEIPLSYYNISASLGNNVFQIVGQGFSKTVILSDGQYDDKYILKNEINTQLLNAGLSNIVCTVSSYKFIFTYSGSTDISINFAVKTSMTQSGDSLNTDIDKNNIKSKLGWLLGFRKIQYVLNNSNIKSECLCDLNGPRYLYLVIDEFINGNQNSFISPLYTSLLNKNIISRITINNTGIGFNDILTVNNFNGYLLTDKRSYNGKVDLQRLKIQLVNEIGIPIDLNGLDFSFCLEVEYE